MQTWSECSQIVSHYLNKNYKLDVKVYSAFNNMIKAFTSLT